MPLISTTGSLSSRGFGEFRRAASAFPTYWAQQIDNGTAGYYRANDLVTLLNSMTGGTNKTPTSPNPTSYAGQRSGMLLASGNIAWSDSAFRTTNNGSTWAQSALISNDIHNNSTRTLGVNASFAYNPTGDVLVYFTSTYNGKDQNVQINPILVRASTQSLTLVAYAGTMTISGSTANSPYIIYAPNLNRYYIFVHAGLTTGCTGGIYTATGVLSFLGTIGIDSVYFTAGVSASGNLIAFQYTGANNRKLIEFTDANLTTFTDYGTVTGLNQVGSSGYGQFKYLPINGKYGLVQNGNSPSFNYSSSSSPASFTRVPITISVPSYSTPSSQGSSIFEDTNGDIYVNLYAQLLPPKGNSVNMSLTYRSTDGGNSFTPIPSSNGGRYGALTIFKNLQ